jgi:hypothetical protein
MRKQTEELTLWIVTISNNQKQGPGTNNPDLVTATYARGQADAEQQLAAWFAKHPERPYRFFTEQPYGYLAGMSTWLPGHISGDKISPKGANSKPLDTPQTSPNT